jgi:hypothetical protein
MNGGLRLCRALMADMQQRGMAPQVGIWTTVVACHAELCEPGRCALKCRFC